MYKRSIFGTDDLFLNLLSNNLVKKIDIAVLRQIFLKKDTYGGSLAYTVLNGDRTKNLLPIKAIVQSCEMVINVC